MTQWNERVYRGLPPHEKARKNGSTTPLASGDTYTGQWGQSDARFSLNVYKRQ